MRYATAWEKLRHNRLGMISLAVVALYVLIAFGTEVYTIFCEWKSMTPKSRPTRTPRQLFPKRLRALKTTFPP